MSRRRIFGMPVIVDLSSRSVKRNRRDLRDLEEAIDCRAQSSGIRGHRDRRLERMREEASELRTVIQQQEQVSND